MTRRQNLALSVALAFALFFSITYLFSSSGSGLATSSKPGTALVPPAPQDARDAAAAEKPFFVDLSAVPAALLEGDSIAPKLENATLKAELGRATWKFLHTMAARFPENPTPEERTTLETFIHLFGRLYPCGDCARHFRELIAQYPPQTSSRNAAAGWLCFAHNIVNERLEKEIFDCNAIGDFYDCGCGEEKKEGAKGTTELKEKDGI
ncbi:hypothetical protein NLU13_5988 [Sarocladium strictum]|uniref:Sulfhydryl oxidase n=1 Tax=Sarocladium strictum TaxID=5046 RepID=A0AA39GFD8_SARSR|nr:hypothetical protein NLU13_5988 [Sarocladium strictum]